MRNFRKELENYLNINRGVVLDDHYIKMILMKAEKIELDAKIQAMKETTNRMLEELGIQWNIII